MNLILQLYAGLGLILLGLVLAIIVLVMIYMRLLKQYQQLKLQKQISEAAIEKATAAQLAKANDNYAEKLKEADKQAKEVISQATQEKKDTETALLKALNQLNQKQQKIILETTNKILYDDQLTKNSTINLESNVSKDIESYSDIQIDQYQQTLEKETKLSQKAIEKNFDQERQTLEDDLENYKQAKTKEIETNIVALVRAVSKETLGKVLSVKEHETLILKALEKAKKEGKI